MSASAINSNPKTYAANVGEAARVVAQTPSDAEVRAKAIQVQKDNIQIIQNSDGTAFVTLKLPADGNGRPIYRPTEQDWVNAARNGTFANTTESADSFMDRTYGVNLVSTTDKAYSKQVNSSLISEISAALEKGIVAPNSSNIVPTIEGMVARSIFAQQKALATINNGTGSNPLATPSYKPLKEISIRVPADNFGKPIKNPESQDWFNAEKNNKYVDIKGDPFQVGKDVFGMKLDSSWPKSYVANQTEIQTKISDLQSNSSKFLKFNKDVAANYFMDFSVLSDIDPNTITNAIAVMSNASTNALNAANEESLRMDNLRKKYDALKALENSVSGDRTAGDNLVDFNVPTKRYVLDKNGDRIPTGATDANGKPVYKTEALTPPNPDLTNDDWANAAEFKSIKELNGGGDINGKTAAKKYFGMDLVSSTSGDDPRSYNLSQNITKISNERSLVDSDMKKISGKFDYSMGNVQTNISLATKVLTQMNDTILKIAQSL